MAPKVIEIVDGFDKPSYDRYLCNSIPSSLISPSSKMHAMCHHPYSSMYISLIPKMSLLLEWTFIHAMAMDFASSLISIKGPEISSLINSRGTNPILTRPLPSCESWCTQWLYYSQPLVVAVFNSIKVHESSHRIMTISSRRITYTRIIDEKLLMTRACSVLMAGQS